ncbi:outer envelope pore protein 24A, chloroplastic-like [Aristolochia californica]|uniref:outer envelope pore protein 24A, chloroplastic-like n=1 Tax=Aristolochia californica TaxID=171875 RepID=UPI0035DAEB6B
MLRTSVRGTYNADKSSAAASFTVSGGDVKLKASMTDATVVNGPSLNGLSLSLEKPGAFMIDYNVPKKDVRFQFMNTVKVADKPLNLTYVHAVRDNRTTVDGSLVLDPANKVSANYAFGSGNCKVKYTYVQGQGSRRTFEPCYDFSKNAWDFAFSQRVFEDDVVRASYHTSNKILGLDWTRSSKNTGSFKVSTSFDLNGEFTAPKITAESTWNFDL